jgi:serine/threonine protein kinase
MCRLLDAVAHMHAHGISHRDLKLENLVLARPRDVASVTLVDFGLAKAARARERMEGVTGTLWYTAPEILKAASYTPLVDLWSLGVVMYLLLTGAPPLSTPLATS